MRKRLLATVVIGGCALFVPAYAQAPDSTNPAAPSVDKPAAAAANTPTAAGAPAAPTTPPEVAAPPPPPPATPEAAPPPAAPDAAAPAASAASGGDQPAPAPKKPMMHHTMMSSGTSNLTPADTKSDIAHRLPAPKLGANASPADYLNAAKMALKAHHTGETQEALEMAETRELDRSSPADQASMPDGGPMVSNIKMALESLSHKDMSATNMAIDKAMAAAH